MNKFERHWASVKDHYFDHNGARYYAGTKLKITYTHKYNNVPAIFVKWCDHDPSLCMIRMTYPWEGRTVTVHIPRNELTNYIDEILEGNHYAEISPKIRYFRDVDIPELFFGWIIYLTCMGILFIFNDRWLGWIVGSIYFFCWRKKIKEENIYTEGK